MKPPMIPSDLSLPERRHFLRRVALAPLCLCLVAGLHAIRVWTCNQTPWKGGGFGMFSTVDDESARFVRCWLVTEKGELPLPVPPAAEKAVAELHAAPTPTRAEALAQRMARQSWRWRDERQAQEAATHGKLTISRVGLEHSIEPVPRDEVDASAIPFRAVRLECLRYRFDAASRSLRAEPVLSVEAMP